LISRFIELAAVSSAAKAGSTTMHFGAAVNRCAPKIRFNIEFFHTL